MIIGSKPIDGGYLILDSEEEKAELIAADPKVVPFVRPFIGGQEYLNGGSRWILTLQNATPIQLRSMPRVLERLKFVREYRLGKRSAKRKQDKEAKLPGISSRALADTPAQFHVTVIPESAILVVPEVSSETRQYIPIG
jgi:hypothetical protein